MGVGNYYRDMWSIRSYTLAPLTNITSSKVKFKWTKIKQEVFKVINWIVASNIFLAYPYFNV